MDKNIQIKIRCSIDLEVQRVFYTIKKIKWYNQMGYLIKLPAKIESASLDEIVKLTKEDIKKIITEEYNAEDYQKIDSIIAKEWDNISPKFFQNLLAVNLKPELSYDLILTKYGVGGSYNLPNKIIFNFNRKTLEDLAKTVVHEIIHLLIESLIEKFEIEHWTKERIVDLMVAKIMPEMTKMQNLPQDVKKIDEIFDKYFPDIEKMIWECKRI